MAGLVQPARLKSLWSGEGSAIHLRQLPQNVDARDKPGHDVAIDSYSASLQASAPSQAQFVFVTGAVTGACAGSAAACGVRPTTAVSRPWLQSCLAAFLASSSVTAFTISLRFSM